MNKFKRVRIHSLLRLNMVCGDFPPCTYMGDKWEYVVHRVNQCGETIEKAKKDFNNGRWIIDRY